MHKGVIVLVKGWTKQEAESKVNDFMNEQIDAQVCDWYQIGGRWCGTLGKYDPKDDPKNYSTCEYCNGTGDRKDLEPPKWKKECNGCNVCHGTGKALSWPTDWRHETDIMKLQDCIEIVKEWQQDPEQAAEKIDKQMQEIYKGEQISTGTRGYYMKRKGELLSQSFCFDCNVYNMESYDYSLPEKFSDRNGSWWAVMVDMHN